MASRLRWWAVPVAVFAVGLLVTGCSSSGESSSVATSAAGLPPEMQVDQDGGGAAEAAAPTSASAGAGAGDSAGGSAEPGSLPVLQDRQVIYTADLQLHLPVSADVADSDYADAQAAAVSAAVAQVRGAVTAAGGFVGGLQQSGSTATIVVRVPATAYETFLASAGQFGEVTSMNEAAQDVTDEYTDVASRIATLQASIDRLRAMLTQATELGDVIALEAELTTREADLESLLGRQAVLDDQISLATVSVSMTASREWVPPVEDEPATGFLGGLQQGWDAFLEFWVGVGAVIGALLPFVPVFALVGLAIWLLVRRGRARRARRVAVLAQPPLAAPEPREPAPRDPAPVG